MHDWIGGLGGGAFLKTRNGALEIAFGLQRVAEGEMAAGRGGIEPDRHAEAIDGLVEAAEPAEDGAEIAVELRTPRLARDRLSQQVDSDGRSTGCRRDTGQQELGVGISRLRREHRAAELLDLGQAAGLQGGSSAVQQTGHIARPDLRGGLIRHMLEREPRVDPGAVPGA